MTTLAYLDGMLAADSQETFDDCGKSLCQKLYYIHKGPNKGDWLGTVGGTFSSHVFLEWYINPRKNRRPELVDFKDSDDEDAFRTLIMKPNGDLYLSSASCVLVPKKTVYFASGHGAAYAMGAMALGKSAGDAVWVACKHDDATCPPVYMAKSGSSELVEIPKPTWLNMDLTERK